VVDYLIIFVFAFIFSFSIRSIIVYIHRGWFSQGFAGDSSGHFTMIRELKKNPRFKRIEQYVIPNEFTYPLAFHRFCSMFSLAFIKKYSYMPNLLIFSFFSAFCFLYLHYFEKEVLGRQDYLMLITGGVIYFVSVSNLIFFGNEIAYIKLSERLLARVSTSLFYLCTINATIWPDPVSFFIAAIMGAIALLTSVFARQVLFFSIPFLALFLFDIRPLIIFLLSFLFSFLISGKFFLKSVRDVVLYWRIYKVYVKPFNLGNMTKWLRLDWIINSVKNFEIKNLALYFMTQDPTKLFFFFFEMFFFIALLPFVYHHTEAVKLYIPVLVSLVLYFATATKRFRHLGESYRYLEYSLYFYLSFFNAYLLVTYLHEFFLLWISFYVISTLILCFLIKYILKPQYPKEDRLKEFIDKLSLISSDVVFPIDMSFAIEISSRSESKTFWWQPGSITSPELWNEYFEEYPYLKKNWGHLFHKHKVTHVLCKKHMLNRTSWKYDFSGLDFLAENEEYIAYKVN
jgi:hypothetical protein